jgi:uncharacterized protein
VSARSFRDRYKPLEQSTVDEQVKTTPADDWPLPEGATLIATASGGTVVSDVHFHGDDITLARRLLDQAGIVNDVSSTIFVDTETTGLSGGTGTHVFLVGLGTFVGDGFRVRQYFLRHPGEERALLDGIEQDVRSAGSLVTYNGRTFDIPMLETRYRMHHRACRFPDHHLDLLHPVRSVWKHRLPGCSLGTVEQHVLGVTRVDDAPGWLIPQMYFSYLQSRRVETLRNVFNHNRQDIVSLARLAGIVHAYQVGLLAPEHPTDRLAVALMHLRSGNVDGAMPVVYSEVGSAMVPSELRYKAVKEATVVLKRLGRFDEALALWQQRMTDPARAIRLFAAEELAKHMEHRSRDHRMALDIARRAADGASLAGDDVMYKSFQKRIYRLEQKIDRARFIASPADEVENV